VGNHLTPIGAVRWRERAKIEGRVRTLRVQPLAGSSSLECVIEDDSGSMSIVFFGRRRIAGIEVGTHLRAQGMAGEHHGRLAMLNPEYELLAKDH
jgi:RecG-like helicase